MPGIYPFDLFKHHTAISFSLESWIDSKIFYLKETSFCCYYTYTYCGIVMYPYIHFSSVEVAVDHAFLLIAEQ